MGAPGGGIRPEHRVVLIKIPRSAPADGAATALFEATSKWWVVSEARRRGGPASPEHAMAVLRGRVVVVYRIDAWQAAPSGERWGFTGVVSGELTALYRGMDVTGYFPPGAANPLRYVNCGAPPAIGVSRPEAAPARVSGSEELADKVSLLMAEPLTHIMLGHRELCHSNLLAWFFEMMPAYADAVFGELTRPASGTGTRREVMREKDNLDLRFCWPDRHPLVIENKVFSLPDEAQLGRYAERASKGGQDPALWLLSLSDPSWRDDRLPLGDHEWRWLRFPDLAERIRKAIPDQDQSYEAHTMRRYANVVDVLSDIVVDTAVGDSDAPVAMPADVRKALGERLCSVLSKLRNLSVANRVHDALTCAKVGVTEVERDFTNGLPVLSWYVTVPCGSGARAGWQLQGNQFRLALKTPHLAGTDSGRRARRFEFAQANEGFFDFTCVDDILQTRNTQVMPIQGGRNPFGFNRYDPDFTYRYKQVIGLTVAQLELAAVAVARKLAPEARG